MAVSHLRDPEDWAVNNLRSSHDDALGLFGEYAIFVMLWHVEDHDEGLVDRCPTCVLPYGRIGEVFGQPSDADCDDCLGTGFEGGYRAKIIRPSVWDFSEETQADSRRGEVHRQTAAVQSTSDFRLKTGDFAIRADNTRYRVRSIVNDRLITGYEHPTRQNTSVGFNYSQLVRDDETSVVYKVPPLTQAELNTLLNPVTPRWPVDYTGDEDIPANGYLI